MWDIPLYISVLQLQIWIWVELFNIINFNWPVRGSNQDRRIADTVIFPRDQPAISKNVKNLSI